MEERLTKLASMNFLLRVDGTDVPCKSFQGFEQEAEYESISEGGLNDRVHIRKKAVSKPCTFQVERYVGPGYEDLLPMGAIFGQDLILMASAAPGTFARPEAAFSFEGCMVTGKKYSGLDAEKAGLLVETTTVAYETMKVDWKDKQA